MNSYIIEKLKEGRTNAKLKQSEVAEMIGIKGNTLSNYENGVSEPDIDTFCALCDIYNIDPSNILNEAYGLGVQGQEFKIKPSEIEIAKKYRFISTHSPDGASVVDTILDREYSIAEKLKEQSEQISKMGMEVAEEIVPTRIIAYYQKLASAGSGDYLFDDIPTNFITVRESEISRNADFVICVDGKSMEPDYMDGEKVFVQKTSEIDLGEVGIFINDNECFIKELGKDCLISRNKSYPDVVPKNGTRLVGKVIGKVE